MSPDPFDLGDLDLSGLSRDDILSALIDAAIVGAPDDAEFSGYELVPGQTPEAQALSAPTEEAPFYDPDQPRDERGRWTSGGSSGGLSREEHAARRDAASGAVRDYLKATHPPTREETAALAGHLSTLTVKQLHELRKEHGLKDPRLLKADFVNALHGYFGQHRQKQAVLSRGREDQARRQAAKQTAQPVPEKAPAASKAVPEPHQSLAKAVAGKEGFTQPFASGPYHAVRHNPTGLHVEAEAGNHSGRFAVINPRTREVHSRHDTAEAAVAAVPGASRIGTGDTTAERELRDRAAQAGKGATAGPYAGAKTDGEKRRVLADLNRRTQEGEPDAAGVAKAGPPPGLDLPAFARDLAAAVEEHGRTHGGVGDRIPAFYDSVGKQYGLSKFDFLRAVHAAAERGAVRPGGWARSIDDVPDPELVYPAGGKLMAYLHPAAGARFGGHLSAPTGETPDASGEGRMADLIPASVPFSADAGGEDGGRYVLKDAPVVFRAGTYDFPPEKGGPFEMTPEEIREALAALPGDGVPITNEHNSRCIFQGKLGRFLMPQASPDFATFGGKVKLAKPVLDLLGAGPIKLSANWDRATKRLKDVSLTGTPRITDAALFAAFAAADPPDEKHVTPHGRAAMQALHDMAARSGALCKSPAGVPPGASDRSAAARPREAGMADAPFTSDHERDALQAVHDTAAGMGAQCATMKLGHPKRAQAMEAMMSEYVQTPAPSAREQELERQLAAFKEQEAQFKERLAAVEKASHEAQFSAAVSRLEAEAVAFVAANSKRLYGKRDRDAVAAVYVNAGRASLGGGAEVQFSDEKGAVTKGTLLDAFKASILARPEHKLDTEQIPGPLTVLFGGEAKDPEDEETERLRKSTEARAARDNARNGSRR